MRAAFLIAVLPSVAAFGSMPDATPMPEPTTCNNEGCATYYSVIMCATP